jgi:hypothetical protein
MKQQQQRWHDYWKSVQSTLRRNSTELHAEHKCVQGSRLTSCQSSGEIPFFRKSDESQSHKDSQKDQSSRPLTRRNYSKWGGSVRLGGRATMVIGSPILNT